MSARNPTPVTVAFGRQVEAFRREHGWSIKAMSAMVPMSPATLIRIQGGTDTTLGTAGRIASVLGVPLGAMLDTGFCRNCHGAPAARIYLPGVQGAGAGSGPVSAHADPTPLTTAFGRQVREARKARRWTQRDLAAAASVGASTVCKAERGTGTLLANAEKIAGALGKPLAELLAPVESETAEPEVTG